jgi:hypothetical protein
VTDPRLQIADRALLRTATAYLTALTFDHPLPEPATEHPEWFATVRAASGIHGLGPFLGLRVMGGEITVPEPVGPWLVGQVERNRERLTRLRSELLTTLAALDERGFDALPIKGGALLLESVESVLWRSFADLDLLVPGGSERELDLHLALAHAGYCLAGQSWKHRQYTACAPGPPLVIGNGEHPDNPRDVEVHDGVVEMFRGFAWDLTPYLLADLTERNGHRVPSDRAMALHLAVHASISALEGTARAINLIDLSRAVQRAGAMPLYLATRDSGLRQHARFVYPAIALAARETADAGCAELRELLAPHVPEAMVEWTTTASLYHVSWAGRHDRPSLDRHAIWARSGVERVRMLTHTLLPAPSILASDEGAGSGPAEVVKGYGRHYRRLARRVGMPFGFRQ